MKTYRVSYRLVPNTEPNVSLVLTYVTDDTNEIAARDHTYNMMADSIQDMFSFYDKEWLRRTTIVRVK